MVLCCSECGSKLLYRDGLRYLSDGSTVQRWLCRNCGFRFSERQNSNTVSDNKGKRQICAVIKEAKNLTTAKETTNLAGEIGKQQQDAKGKIIEFAWKLKREGTSEATISNYVRFLNHLQSKGANLLDPDSIKDAIALQETWSSSTKSLVVAAYQKFASLNGLTWKPPKYKANQKVPFIPLESEIDTLIAYCGKKVSTILQLLKETGMRIGEALKLKWIDIDFEHNIVTLNETEKSGKPRMFKVSAKLITMINRLPKKNDKVFGNRLVSSIVSEFTEQRRRVAHKLQNPRLLQIHFHTLRHFKATMEYHKTKDIIHVKELLGHRSIENTMRYTQLVSFESDEFHSATAKNIEEAKQLIEAGFEYVCDIENVKLFRKRK